MCLEAAGFKFLSVRNTWAENDNQKQPAVVVNDRWSFMDMVCLYETHKHSKVFDYHKLVAYSGYLHTYFVK